MQNSQEEVPVRQEEVELCQEEVMLCQKKWLTARRNATGTLLNQWK
jgi:hypothetical protein